MWFSSLIRQFFFFIDEIVYNFITALYDLMISIARTSILSQADILDMAERVYKLLAVFMIFKVTFSLIMYTVNPDDFTDKSKGISKLGTNIIISLALLILTPYIFNYAFKLQTIILEDNSLAVLIFGEEMENPESNPINTAGDTIAFITMSPFFRPNEALVPLSDCINLTEGKGKFNESCSGLDNHFQPIEEDETSLYYLTKDGDSENEDFTRQTLVNYVAGVRYGVFGLMFREDMAVAYAEIEDEDEFIMQYKFIFSTVLGIVVVLLLLSFCIDVGLRSVKLAFLQLIAPVPILSFVDPKSGKDGMFKKWYQMCFKTYISLFIRLLALFFMIYIISRLDEMTDIVDGTYVTNTYVKVFVLIGVLMFVKQFPKILEGLGVKLDGDGKFTLNPLKKFEEQAFAGKNLTGLARGGLMGLAGAASGAGFGRAFTGAWRGFKGGKGWAETGKLEAEMNRKMRQAKLDGSTFRGRLGSRFAAATGLRSSSEMLAREKSLLETQQKQYDNNIKSIEDKIAPTRREIDKRKKFADAIKAMETRAKEEIQSGNSSIGKEYLKRKAEYEVLKQNGVDYMGTDANGNSVKMNRAATAAELAEAEERMNSYLNNQGMKEYMTGAINGTIDDKTFENMRKNAEQIGSTIGEKLASDGSIIHSQLGSTKEDIGDLERSIYGDEQEIENIKLQKADLGDRMRDIDKREKIAKSNENAVK